MQEIAIFGWFTPNQAALRPPRWGAPTTHVHFDTFRLSTLTLLDRPRFVEWPPSLAHDRSIWLETVHFRPDSVGSSNKRVKDFQVILYVFKQLIMILKYKIVKRWFSTAIVGGPNFNRC